MNGVGLWLTADGGTSWLPSVPPHVRNIGDPVARISQIKFADRRHGWIAAADVKGGIRPAYARHMEIDRTADGGRTWRWSLPPGCAESCNGANLSFLDPRRGFALVRSNDPPRLYTTADGGASWELVSRPPFAGRIVFLDPRIGLGTNGALYRTENGGRTWRRVRLTSRPATVDPPTFFGRDGVVPVRIRTPGTRRQLLLVYTTKDGGATWERHPGPALRLSQATWGLPLDALFSAPSPNDWVVAGERLLAVTADAGRSWRIVRPVDLPPRASIWQVVFTSARDGWAIFGLQGEGGAALVRTSDGGRTWTPLAPPVPTMR